MITQYGSRVRDSLPTSQNRLIKFLMTMTVGYLASTLKLPDAIHIENSFNLTNWEEDHVLYWPAKFYEALRFCKAQGW